jgi:hypothetical protein
VVNSNNLPQSPLAAGGRTPNVKMTVELVHWRDRRGRFAKADDYMRERMRLNTRAELETMKKLARDTSPVGKAPKPDSERFKNQWRVAFKENKDGGLGELENVSPIAQFVMLPTRPHIIKARKAKYLRFVGRGGDVVFRKQVSHPGTKGNDLLTKVYQASEASLQRSLQKAAEQASAYLATVFS